MPLTALALNCSLKGSAEKSSTDKILNEVLQELAKYDVTSEVIRVVDYNIKPGVKSDEGEGDDWPHLRAKVLAADILIFGSPIWLGQPSSVAKRILERMDAFLGETDDKQRMPPYGKVAVVAIVGNEDGAHHCHAEIFQALNDVGYTIAPGAGTYWVGQAMASTDYKYLKSPYDKTLQTNRTSAANAMHLAKLLKANPYEGL
ncbi:MAG: flavodoxin family protein [Hyphomicrobium sp.]|nr:flavodoxin family protein [Hyphomicrobium sp.]